MLVIIVGCGRMGSYIANSLSGKGESVIVIDEDDGSFRFLTTDFSGFQVIGDATELEVLKQAKVDQADVMMVLTGDDNINLAVAQIGRHFFNVPHTVARVFDPTREAIFRKLDINTICPTRLASESLLDMVNMVGQMEVTG